MTQPIFDLVPRNVHLEESASVLIAEAKAIVVTDDDSYVAASEFLKGCKALEKNILDWINPLVKKSHAAWKEAKDRENQMTGPVKNAYLYVSREMGRYVSECEEERRREEAAIRAAELEEAQEQRLKYAMHLEESGFANAAEAVLEAPLQIETQKVESWAPKVSDTAARVTWTYRVVDAALIPREYLIPDEKKIGGVVRAMKEATNIPGVEVYTETKVHVRS